MNLYTIFNKQTGEIKQISKIDLNSIKDTSLKDSSSKSSYINRILTENSDLDVSYIPYKEYIDISEEKIDIVDKKLVLKSIEELIEEANLNEIQLKIDIEKERIITEQAIENLKSTGIIPVDYKK